MNGFTTLKKKKKKSCRVNIFQNIALELEVSLSVSKIFAHSFVMYLYDVGVIFAKNQGLVAVGLANLSKAKVTFNHLEQVNIL